MKTSFWRLLPAVWHCGIAGIFLISLSVRGAEDSHPAVLLTNAASVRKLSPEMASKGLPVHLRGVVTFGFNSTSCFVQDNTAGIYVGSGSELGAVNVGDQVTLEGITGPGEYAPIVRPRSMQVVGRAEMPQARKVSFEELETGREDSQWVEVEGSVRAVSGDPANFQILEIVTGGGRLSAFIPNGAQSNLVQLVDSRVRVRGVCGTWFNRLRQLFGVRLMVPRPEDITVTEPAPTNALAQAAQPISSLLRFAPNAPQGRRVKVKGTVVLQQPRRALFVQDEQHGLYVQTRQLGELKPGDRVELLGFPVRGDYTPTLQDAVWQKVSSGPEPQAAVVWPDEALTGLHDSQLVTIEGRLLEFAHNDQETVLMLEADKALFSAHLYSALSPSAITAMQNGSRLRLTGVCRIEVGEDWAAGPQWRAKAFRILLRSTDDVKVLALPPWWTLRRLLWAVGVLTAVVLVSLTWAALLRRKVGQQTKIIRDQLDAEACLKERYQDLFENANDMVYTHDLTGRITSVNLAGERLLGHSRESITQGWLTDFVVEEQRTAVTQWLEQIAAGTAPETTEWDFKTTKNGRARLEISTRLIDREGRWVEVEGIARDVSERRRMEKEILEISTREQRRIGHDLHDGVCQQLAGISFLTEILADKLEEQLRPEAAEAHKITELVNHTNKQTKGVARGLFPVQLEENGLASALEELAESTGSFFNTRCGFACETPVAIRDHTVAHHLYFIAQEAILNAVKHGKAKSIEVRLAAMNGSGCVLSVRDDGLGLGTVSTQSTGMGIRIMNYRARMIGGELHLGPAPEGGTEVACRLVGQEAPLN